MTRSAILMSTWSAWIGALRFRLRGRHSGPAWTLQGNLDPAALFASDDDLRQAVTRVLAEAEGGGHIFNLGHGIWPQTDPDAVARLIGHVHELSAKRE